MKTRPSRDRQRGSAMLVTLILVAALLAGVAVLVSLQLTTTKSTELTREGLASLHCAEAGLSIVHKKVADSKSTTIATINTNIASFVATYADLDGDGSVDFTITVTDNDDDSDQSTDADSRVWLVSRCIKYPDTPKEVRELVEFDPTPTRYEWQEGRAFGNGNANAYN